MHPFPAPGRHSRLPAGGTGATQERPQHMEENTPQLWIIVGIVLAVVVVAAIVVALFRRRAPKTSTASAPAKNDGKPVEIYVGNLNYDMTDEQLRKEFARYGVVKSARVIGHRANGRSKGFGFVEMPHRNEAEIAISKLNGRDVMGRKLRVNEARRGIPKDDGRKGK